MRPRFVSFGIAAVVFALDRLTKVLVEDHLAVWETRVVIPGFFNIVHARNKGAAFSILADLNSDWRTLLLVGLSLAVAAFVAVLLWQPPRKGTALPPLTRFALALVLGGAAGNLYDRILYGSVTDFLELYVHRLIWPAFNVADSAITIGACLLLVDLWRGRKQAVHI